MIMFFPADDYVDVIYLNSERLAEIYLQLKIMAEKEFNFMHLFLESLVGVFIIGVNAEVLRTVMNDDNDLCVLFCRLIVLMLMLIM